MKIAFPQDFLSEIKGLHLLLDTSFFIDAFIHPVAFGTFINQLKSNDVTLITLNIVLIEFLKGAADTKKYLEKKEFVDDIVDQFIPITEDIYGGYLFDLIKLYREDGKAASIVDLLLGATLYRYANHLYLASKNTVDFPTNIYTLKTYFHLLHRKSIQNYGIYSFERK